jgi:uncharacterized integral membrane protein
MIRLIFSILFFIILAVFIALNAQYTTSVNFFSYTFESVSIAAVVTITLAIGVVYSFMLYLSSYFAKSRSERLKQLKMKNKLKASELAEKAKEIDLSTPDSTEEAQAPKKLSNLLRKRVKKPRRTNKNALKTADANSAETVGETVSVVPGDTE